MTPITYTHISRNENRFKKLSYIISVKDNSDFDDIFDVTECVYTYEKCTFSLGAKKCWKILTRQVDKDKLDKYYEKVSGVKKFKIVE